MAGIGDEIAERLRDLATRRLGFEAAWQQAADVACPEASDFLPMGNIIGGSLGGSIMDVPKATQRSVKIYDTTAITAVDRLASGLEALIVPQSDYWHSLDIETFKRKPLKDDAKVWLEDLREGMFKVRYDADSGWVTAIQTCLRRMIVFGNAFMWVEDATMQGPRSHGDKDEFIRYQYIPLNEAYVAEDSTGRIDTFIRPYYLTARQALQKFGERLPATIKALANSPGNSERRFTFVQAILPRRDFKTNVLGIKGAPWQSVHIELESKAVVQDSGFWEFPVVDFRWLPEPGRVYAEGPIMRCLADIQSLQLLAKNELAANEQSVNPPLLVANAGVMNRPSARPGAINFGGISPNGQKLIEPMNLGQRLDFASQIKMAAQAQVKESLYINLFELLTRSPEMSATQAVIRANEKGELLGPAGSRVQQGLSRLVERELGILTRAGIFDNDSLFHPPSSVFEAGGKRLVPEFRSPLDRLRHMKEAEGTMRTLEVMSPLAQSDPTVTDNFDSDTMSRGLAEVFGMPARFLRPQEQVDAIRQQRAQAQAAQQQAAIAQQLAAASAQGSTALQNMQQTGI